MLSWLNLYPLGLTYLLLSSRVSGQVGNLWLRRLLYGLSRNNYTMSNCSVKALTLWQALWQALVLVSDCFIQVTSSETYSEIYFAMHSTVIKSRFDRNGHFNLIVTLCICWAVIIMARMVVGHPAEASSAAKLAFVLFQANTSFV